MDIERLFELAGVSNNEILLEAAYDGMINSLKKDYPNNLKEIDDNIKQAKTILKKQDRMVWYIKVLRAYLSNNINNVKGSYNFKDMESFNNDLFHYYGYNIGDIENTQYVNQNISELFDTFQGYINKYQQSDKAPVPVKHGDKELIKCNDGTSWWFIDRAYCSEEGRSGKHCGNVVGKHDTTQRILSLRTATHNVILTFILEQNGYLGEMKAKANRKPDTKYHPNIMQLLLNPMVKGIKSSGYAPYMNFSIFDLSEQNIQVLLNHGKKSFIGDQISAEPIEFLKAPSYIKNNPEYQQIAVKQYPALKYLIGKEENDLDSWEQAIEADWDLIIYAPENYPNFKEQVTYHFYSQPADLMKAPKSVSQDFDILKPVIERQGENIVYVMPNVPRYEELCKISVAQNGGNLQYIPPEYHTFELCKSAISKFGHNLEYVKSELYKFTIAEQLELCMLAASNIKNNISYYEEFFDYVPLDKFTDEEQLKICKIAVTNSGKSLKYIPVKLRNYELGKIAVAGNSAVLPTALKIDNITDEQQIELCKLAITHDGNALDLVPDNLRTLEVCKLAVADAVTALDDVPFDKFTDDEQLAICKIAVSNRDYAISYIPKKLKDKFKQELNITESVDFNYFRML